MSDKLPVPYSSVDFLRRLDSLAPPEVILIGDILAQIVACWGSIADNLGVVLTGERWQHILTRHPEMVNVRYLLPALVLSPDEVHRNSAQTNIAIYYRAISKGAYMRAAVAMQSEAGFFKHSILSGRLCREDEVRRGHPRLAWKRE